MHSNRLLFLRNVSISGVNGLVTLTILLIAPLGLAAVITCTLAVTFGTFLIGTTSDQVLRWLEAGRSQTLTQRQ
jgi:hypothetical protein